MGGLRGIAARWAGGRAGLAAASAPSNPRPAPRTGLVRLQQGVHRAPARARHVSFEQPQRFDVQPHAALGKGGHQGAPGVGGAGSSHWSWAGWGGENNGWSRGRRPGLAGPPPQIFQSHLPPARRPAWRPPPRPPAAPPRMSWRPPRGPSSCGFWRRSPWTTTAVRPRRFGRTTAAPRRPRNGAHQARW